jgi:hypothetical protein
MMVLPNIAHQSTAGPEEILRPVRPWFIAVTVGAALAANLLPLSGVAFALRPDFIALVLLYWCIQEPRYVGVGVAWGVGLLMDVGDARLFDSTHSPTLLAAAEYFRRRVLAVAAGGSGCRAAGLVRGTGPAGPVRRRRAAAALDVCGAAAGRRSPLARCHARAAVAAASAALFGRAVKLPARLR